MRQREKERENNTDNIRTHIYSDQNFLFGFSNIIMSGSILDYATICAYFALIDKKSVINGRWKIVGGLRFVIHDFKENFFFFF